MYALDVTVAYRDGTQVPATLTQYALGRWQLHAAKLGVDGDPTNAGLSLAALRYQAWAELHRDTTHRPAYDTWDATVDGVWPVDGATGAVVPTGAVSAA